MAYVPPTEPFYTQEKGQEVCKQQYEYVNVNLRSRPPAPSGISVTGNSLNRRQKMKLNNVNEVEKNIKIESSWSEHVHPEQGDLFYIDIDSQSRIRKNSLPNSQGCLPSPQRYKVAGLSRQNGDCHAKGGTVATGRLQGSGNEDEGDKLQAQAELRKKSEQLHHALSKKQSYSRNGEIRGSGHHRRPKIVNIHADPSFIQQNNSKLLLSQDTLSLNPKQNGAIQQQTNGPQLKDVILVPDYSRHADLSNSKANGTELFELLLGIVLCRYKQRSGTSAGVSENIDVQQENKERKLVVQGVVTGSVADKSGSVHRGDMLLYLNGQEVTWSNLSTIIQNNRREVRLTFQVPRIIGPTSCSQSGSSSSDSSRLPAYQNLCLLVTGRDIFSMQQQLLQHTCVALYLTLTSSAKENGPHDDIVYSFPPQEEALTMIRGLFLTLSSSLFDIVQSGADSSVLLIGNKLINVVYHQHKRDVFVLAAPANRVPLCKLRSGMADICRMLTTVFSAVDKAFYSGESGQLDQVFALFFYRLLCQPDPNNSNATNTDTLHDSLPSWWFTVDGMPAAPLLQLSEENKLICDEILSEFEAVDFDDFLEENELYSRRSYLVIGCSLFYKGYLVCNHLQESDLRDVYGFLKCHNLLMLASSQPIDELVIWQEIHLVRHQLSGMNNAAAFGYQESPARWFMLIVGMKHFLLATILEAGGCSQVALGKPGPHPLFVDQARATLVQLDTDDVHMSACCQDRISEEVEYSLTTRVERFVTRARQPKEDMGNVVKSSVTSKPPSPGRAGSDNSLKYRSSPRTDRKPGKDSGDAGGDNGTMVRQGSKLSYGSNDSGGSGSSTGASKSKSSRFSSLLDISSIGRSMSALHIDTIGTQTPQAKLARGTDNVLFHFIHHNNVEGILVIPPDSAGSVALSSVEAEVLVNFHRCVLSIHELFCQRDAQEKQESSQSLFKRDAFLTRGIEEHGLLFHCTTMLATGADRRVSPVISYWVVGRRFSCHSAKHELYVCFHESVSQSLVEMAFALGFGS